VGIGLTLYRFVPFLQKSYVFLTYGVSLVRFSCDSLSSACKLELEKVTIIGEKTR
jgi:hypothetical protein